MEQPVMKKHILFYFLYATLFMSCGNGAKNNENDSAQKAADLTESDPSIPHEVSKGNKTYAFMPDTAVKSVILGNPKCLKGFYRANGSNAVSLGGGHHALTYYNRTKSNSEEMELLITEDTNGDDVVYAFIVQREGEEKAPALAAAPIPATDMNFITGHGIYIGMPFDHVMSVYSNQSFMQWEKGDTVYLQYKPKPKDKNYYKRYKPESYSVVYKFKDGTLRRMEYTVDPKQFEKQ
ncbi:hypothetical protein BH11BAC7_BH11BAC7_35630 [soil metagenome]